jgi:PAS domain S-box-containing protein/diguanylate cyclase (GGDEF)-like protein
MNLQLRYISITMTLALLLFSLVVFYVVHKQVTESRLMDAATNSHLNDLVGDSMLLEHALLHQDYAFVRTWVANKASKRNVEEVFVVDPELKVIAAHQIQFEDQYIADIRPVLLDKSNHHLKHSKSLIIHYQDDNSKIMLISRLEFFDVQAQSTGHQGFIYLLANLDNYQTLSNELFDRTVWVYSITIIVFSILLYYFLRRLIAQRMSNISNVLSRYSQGDKSARAIVQPTGEFATVEKLLNNTFEKLNLQQQMAKEEHQYTEQIFSAITDGIITINTEGEIVRCNQQSVDMFGYNDQDQLVGKNVKCLIPKQYHNDHEEHVYRENKREVRQGVINVLRKVEGVRANGLTIPLEIVITESEINNQRFYSAFIRDQTEQHSHEEHINKLAFYDSLTQLLNFNGLEKEFYELHEAEQSSNCFMYLFDLDGLGALNYSYGFSIGDSYLVEFSLLLKRLKLNNKLVARINTGKFLLLSSDQPKQTLLELKALLHQTLALPTMEIAISFCCGYSDLDNCAELGDHFRCCEMALRQAKIQGRGTFLPAEKKWIEELTNNARLLHHLEQAMEKNELYFNFQAKYDTHTELPCSAEALIRWRFKGELISPAVFIPLAEQGHLMPAIDQWVIASACSIIRDWLNQNIKVQPISINVSARNLFNKETIDYIFQQVGEFQIPAGLLEIEVTEYGLISDFSKAKAAMLRLYKSGIAIAIDDYGTGNSNLASVLSLPVKHLKIDQSFINEGLKNKKGKVILSSILSLGKSLDIKITAEGVETKEQSDFLRQNGCNYIQGYYYSKPLEQMHYESLIIESKINHL